MFPGSELTDFVCVTEVLPGLARCPEKELAQVQIIRCFEHHIFSEIKRFSRSFEMPLPKKNPFSNKNFSVVL